MCVFMFDIKNKYVKNIFGFVNWIVYERFKVIYEDIQRTIFSYATQNTLPYDTNDVAINMTPGLKQCIRQCHMIQGNIIVQQ